VQSETATVRELSTRLERSALLPCGSRTVYAVFFWRSSVVQSKRARNKLDALSWPSFLHVVAVDLDHAKELADWFEVTTVPMLAVVRDGAMLCVEFEISQTSCEQLALSGRRQLAAMRSHSA
jgi:hypothetical protein